MDVKVNVGTLAAHCFAFFPLAVDSMSASSGNAYTAGFAHTAHSHIFCSRMLSISASIKTVINVEPVPKKIGADIGVEK